jgi:hypothetical protein
VKNLLGGGATMAEGVVELDTIAELSLALIGFSALLAMFRGGSIHTWQPRTRVAFWLIISYGFGALVFSLLPSVLRDIGAASWASAMLTLAMFHFVTFSLFLRRHFILDASGDPSPNAASWVLGGLITGATLLVLIFGAAGGLAGPSYQLYHLGVVACLLIASLAFVSVLRLEKHAA